MEGLARADRALLLELVKADDAEEIQDALQRMGAEEVFDNRSSWHMRTLVAECSGVVERLRAAEEEAEAVEVLNTLVSMAENSRDLQVRHFTSLHLLHFTFTLHVTSLHFTYSTF